MTKKILAVKNGKEPNKEPYQKNQIYKITQTNFHN